jgi:hypothetical protein
MIRGLNYSTVITSLGCSPKVEHTTRAQATGSTWAPSDRSFLRSVENLDASPWGARGGERVAPVRRQRTRYRRNHEQYSSAYADRYDSQNR